LPLKGKIMNTWEVEVSDVLASQEVNNIAVALGNSKTTPSIKRVLQSRLDGDSEMVREHIVWALEQH